MKTLAREGAFAGARFLPRKAGSGLGMRRQACTRPWGM